MLNIQTPTKEMLGAGKAKREVGAWVVAVTTLGCVVRCVNVLRIDF